MGSINPHESFRVRLICKNIKLKLQKVLKHVKIETKCFRSVWSVSSDDQTDRKRLSLNFNSLYLKFYFFFTFISEMYMRLI